MYDRDNEALLSHLRSKYGFPHARAENLDHEPITHHELQTQFASESGARKLILLRNRSNERFLNLAMPVASVHDAVQGRSAVAFFSLEPLLDGRWGIYLRGYSRLFHVTGLKEALASAPFPNLSHLAPGDVLSNDIALHFLAA